MTPAEACRALLDALSAADGRRQKRKRDTTADAIGLAIKRRLLERVVSEAPPADELEACLLRACRDLTAPLGASRAVAQEILADWHLALASPGFRAWLEAGAPSADGD